MTGFVYRWIDTSNKMYYIGSHKGTPDDGYIGSGTWFMRAYSKRPDSFVRQILYIGEHYVELEGFILKELNARLDSNSYNLTNRASFKPKDFKHSYDNKKMWSKKRRGDGNGMYGKNHSNNTKNKMSQNRTEHIYFCEHTSKSYNTVGELAEDLGLSKPYIYTMCNGHDNNKYGITKIKKQSK